MAQVGRGVTDFSPPSSVPETILVVGATGLIGGYVVAALRREGYAVRGAARNVREATHWWPSVQWRRADLARFSDADWRPLLDGVAAVVNCAGALQESGEDKLAAVHAEGLRTLAQAAYTTGVRRFVHISAAGVAEGRATAFNATKLAGERALADTELDWVILRPGFVLAPAAYGGSALLRGLAAFPGCIPAVHASAPVQVVGIEDLTGAVLRAMLPDAPLRIRVDLVADEDTRLADVLRAIRAWLGLHPAPVLQLPAWTARIASAGADALVVLGWRSPLRSTAVAQLAAGVTGDAAQGARWLGRPLAPLSALLERNPAGVQERWFAQLYFLKPLVLATLVLFWAVSGVVGVLRLDQAAMVLIRAGADPGLARGLVLAGSATDLLLAALVCHRRTARAGLLGMLAVTAGYLGAATLLRPDLWADPLGPLVKSVPAAVLALAALALLSDR